MCLICYSRLEVCSYSGYKVYPDHGKRAIRGDSSQCHFLSGKCERSHYLKRNPREVSWTVLYRRKHKKGAVEEQTRKCSKKVNKTARAFAGASVAEIMAKRNQNPEVRQAMREQAIRALKEKQKVKEAEKKAEKAELKKKNVSSEVPYLGVARTVEKNAERELGDEYGWKQVHGDVFRSPSGALYFSCLIGNGIHIAVVAVIVTLLALIGRMYTERGGVLSTIIFVYALFSPVNGFIGGRTYCSIGGKNWIRQFFFGSLLVPVLLAIIALSINTLALFYQTSRVLPFLTMLAVFAIIAFVILPLNLIGTVLGRNIGRPSTPGAIGGGSSANPCRVNAVPRPIPAAKWFTKPHVISFIGGVLPFGSIFIEMYFIFTSFWAYKVYYVYGFTLLVIFILIVVTGCSTVVCTYFLLNAEDYRWQWISFFSGASTAVYVYIYSIYYFLFKTKMFGLFQTAFYFSYMAFFCFALGCMCGAVGYLSARRFVRAIYSTVKID
ncbi:hypothetical protein Aperf_G00000110799 [Anoplocephala perfoliata]